MRFESPPNNSKFPVHSSLNSQVAFGYFFGLAHNDDENFQEPACRLPNNSPTFKYSVRGRLQRPQARLRQVHHQRVQADRHQGDRQLPNFTLDQQTVPRVPLKWIYHQHQQDISAVSLSLSLFGEMHFLDRCGSYDFLCFSCAQQTIIFPPQLVNKTGPSTETETRAWPLHWLRESVSQRFTHVFTTVLPSLLTVRVREREKERATLQTTLTNKNEHFVCLTFFLLLASRPPDLYQPQNSKITLHSNWFVET